MTRANTDGLFVELGYFDPEEYLVYVAEAAVAVSAEFSISCDATEIPGGVIVEASGAFVAEFAQTATVGVIKETAVAITDAFAATLTADAFKNHTAALDVVTNLESTANKTVDPGSLLEFFADLNNIADRIAGFDSALSAEFDFSADPIVSIESAANLESSAALSCDANVVNFIEFASAISAAATVTAEGIEYVARTNPFSRPINLLPPVTFSTTAQEGTHSLSVTATNATTQTSNSFNISSNEDFLIEFQVRLNGFYTLNDEWEILTYGGTSSNQGWRIKMPGDRDEIFFRFWDGTQFRFAREQLILGNQYSTTAWTRVRVTRVNGVITISTNNTNVSSRTTNTYTGAISAASPLNRLDFWSSSNGAILFDDFIYSRGISSRTRPAPTATTVVEYGFNNTANDNWIRTFSESFALTATATQTVTAIKLVEGTADLVSSAAVDAIIGKSQEAEANFETVASQLTAAGKIGDFFVNADVQATLDIDPDLFKEYSSDLAVTTEQNTVSAKVTDINATLNSEFAMVTENQGTIAGAAVLVSEFGQTVAGVTTKPGSADLISEFTQTAAGIKAVEAAATIAAEFNIAAENSRIRDNAAAFETVASQLTGAAKVGDFLIDCVVNSTVTAEGNVLTGNVVALNVDTAIVTDAVKITDVGSTLVGQTALSIEAIAGIIGSADIVSETNLSADADRIASGSSAAETVSSVVAITNARFDSAADLDINFSLGAEISRTRPAAADLNSTVQLNVLAGITVEGAAVLPAISAVLAVGQELRLDVYVYTIPAESRTANIRREDREYTIRQENRTYSIQGT